MADKSVLGWDTVAEYEVAPTTSDSDDGKKIRQAETKTLTKKKSKKSNKHSLRVPNFGFPVSRSHSRLHTPGSTKLQPQISIKQFYPGRLLSTRAMAQ